MSSCLKAGVSAPVPNNGGGPRRGQDFRLRQLRSRTPRYRSAMRESRAMHTDNGSVSSASHKRPREGRPTGLLQLRGERVPNAPRIELGELGSDAGGWQQGDGSISAARRPGLTAPGSFLQRYDGDDG